MTERLYRIADPAGYIVGDRDYTEAELGRAIARAIRTRGWRKNLIVYLVPKGDTFRTWHGSTPLSATSTSTACAAPRSER